MTYEYADELKRISAEVRKDILRMVGVAHSGSFETSFFVADLLVYLYWHEIQNTNKSDSKNLKDKLILNIPEAVPALYAVLARKGFFAREHLWNYRRLGALLSAMPDYRRIPGVDAPCIFTEPAVAAAGAFAEYSADVRRVFFIVSENSLKSRDFANEALRLGKERVGKIFMIVLFPVLSAASNLALKLKYFMNFLTSVSWNVCYGPLNDFALLSDTFDLLSDDERPKALFLSSSGHKELLMLSKCQSELKTHLSIGELEIALEELEGMCND